MKIAIPLDENHQNICPAFGRTPFIMYYNTENDSYLVEKNIAENERGGAGLKTAQIMLDHNIDAIITYRLGENAAEVFKLAEAKIYKAEDVDVFQNLLLFKENKLQPLTKFHAGFQGKL